MLIKVAVETIPPITLIAIRVFIAAILLSAIVIWKGESLPRDGKTWRYSSPALGPRLCWRGSSSLSIARLPVC
ncbi:MAG: hypothetical protein QMB02_06030 [Rhodospirillales bacterium]